MVGGGGGAGVGGGGGGGNQALCRRKRVAGERGVHVGQGRATAGRATGVCSRIRTHTPGSVRAARMTGVHRRAARAEPGTVRGLCGQGPVDAAPPAARTVVRLAKQAPRAFPPGGQAVKGAWGLPSIASDGPSLLATS